MKVLVATIFVLLCTMALCSYVQERVYSPPTCCFTYTPQKIPRGKVVNYFKTSSQCPRPGIVFFTRKGLYICANPTDNWVQEYFRDLEKNA
ncbi:C-C motif chemokine 3-like [Balaenoptera musculus]|uniref:C-C motif chemokine n=1 Tax=Balaenoptera musculus TaxID=9771 RepID=A0A8B8W854_BALMU|nr:C-C motif chemokine 3-like [Balaenoptera musculus]